MKLNCATVITDYENKPIIDQQTKEQVTYRKVFVNAINAVLEKETLTGEQKAKVYQISVKLYDSDEVDLTVDQMSFIKERVGKTLPPLIYGRTCEFFGEK